MVKPAIAIIAMLLAGPAQADLKYELLDTDGIRSVLVKGTFDPRDDVYGLLNAVITHKTRLVTFDSPGGTVWKALEMGRLIRKHQLATVQSRMYECSSACAFAFMGGAIRIADAGSIGVHKFYYEDSRLTAQQATSSAQSEVKTIMEYMGEMGISQDLMPLMLDYEATDMRYLSISEMERFHVTSSRLELAMRQAAEMSNSATPSLDNQAQQAEEQYQNLPEVNGPIPLQKPDPSSKQGRLGSE